MLRIRQLQLPINHSTVDLRNAISKTLRFKPGVQFQHEIHQQAIDARKNRAVQFSYSVDVSLDPDREEQILARNISNVSFHAPTPFAIPRHQGSARPLIVGMGPCGLFAALVLCHAGCPPVIIERGKQAGPRARDVTRFWRTGQFDTESNVQFGEGGAGTFSDGKLYTRIRDHKRCRWILEQLVRFGAPSSVLIKSRPHIGTDRLIKVLRNLRSWLLDQGSELRFQCRLTDLFIENGRLQGVTVESGDTFEGPVILATGHSARDVFELLHRSGVPMEAKPFSVGVRIEHPQELIDRTQYGRQAGHPLLGSAAYKFACRGSTGRGVYSFCMCPGGLVVAAASEPGGLVTNGMSSYARDESNANAGFMVDVLPKDIPGSNPLRGVEYQRRLEAAAFEAGGGGFRAPAQRLGDFLKQRASSRLGDVIPSYRPGVVPCDLHECLPAYITREIREAVPVVERKLRGFSLENAVLTAVESRSSSPVRVPRDPHTLECIAASGLYPAGEGAGYAGGIISAAVDGMRVAEAVGRRP